MIDSNLQKIISEAKDKYKKEIDKSRNKEQVKSKQKEISKIIKRYDVEYLNSFLKEMFLIFPKMRINYSENSILINKHGDYTQYGSDRLKGRDEVSFIVKVVEEFIQKPFSSKNIIVFKSKFVKKESIEKQYLYPSDFEEFVFSKIDFDSTNEEIYLEIQKNFPKAIENYF